MKFWFYDFIEEMADTISKMWTNHKKKKNPEYVATEELKKRIRLIIIVFLALVLVCSVLYLVMQMKVSFLQQ